MSAQWSRGEQIGYRLVSLVTYWSHLSQIDHIGHHWSHIGQLTENPKLLLNWAISLFIRVDLPGRKHLIKRDHWHREVKEGWKRILEVKTTKMYLRRMGQTSLKAEGRLLLLETPLMLILWSLKLRSLFDELARWWTEPGSPFCLTQTLKRLHHCSCLQGLVGSGWRSEARAGW